MLWMAPGNFTAIVVAAECVRFKLYLTFTSSNSGTLAGLMGGTRRRHATIATTRARIAVRPIGIA